MNKLEMIRGTINFVATLGVGTVVSDILKKVQPAQSKGAVEKLLRKAGGFAVGMYVTDKITEHIDNKWTSTFKKEEDSEIETAEIIEELDEEA